MNRKNFFFVVPIFFAALLLMAFANIEKVDEVPAIIDGLDDSTTSRNTNLPLGYNDLFAASGPCATCHNSMVNLQGVPVGIANDWRSTMMANAGKDPLWQAKVSHEGLVDPGHKVALEDVCTTCHAPVGNINAHHLGQSYYSLAEMKTNPLALDGVQCTVCH